jgi:acetamidase/formamidase
VGSGSIHEIRSDAFSYVWDQSIEPAAEIDSGQTILLHARDASDEQIHRNSTADDVAGIDFSHVNPVSGPVFVKGAKPGDALAVEVIELRPSTWGWTAIIPGFGLLAEEFAEPWLRISEIDADRGIVRFSDRIALPLRPFPGTIGVAHAEAGPHPILPPTCWGGNLDTKHLTAGTVLLLPVGVEGALLSLGDTHAAQGDGEVCGTAIESAMDVVIRVSVRRQHQITAPQLHVPSIGGATPGYHICTGVGPDLMDAARDAVRAMITHLGERYGLEPEEAYALTSVACDLRIHELVDSPNWVVGACLPDDIVQ